MAASITLPPLSDYVFREQLEEATNRAREGHHFSICGLPGTGKSTFVSQLTEPRVLEQLGLGQECLMIRLDGQKFADRSFEQIRGAIVTALDRAHSSRSVTCTLEDAREKSSYQDLKDAVRGFKGSRPVLVLDNCSDLSVCSNPAAKPERSVCDELLRLSNNYPLTVVTVLNSPPSDRTCIARVRDQFSPIDLTLSPDQARRFIAGELGVENGLSDEIIGWAGENLFLLDHACGWIVSLGANPMDPTLFRLFKEGGQGLPEWVRKQEIALVNRNGWHSCAFFRRMVYEMCFQDAQRLFAKWWKILDEQERMILLAMNELQRLTSRWQSEMGGLLIKGVAQRQEMRVSVHPRLFSDYVSRQSTMFHAGPFRLDLNQIQTVHVNDTPRTLSAEQACVFFRLILHRNDWVPYRQLHADLYAPYVNGMGLGIHELERLSAIAVDVELDELRRVLKTASIERVPPNRDALPKKYRLVV